MFFAAVYSSTRTDGLQTDTSDSQSGPALQGERTFGKYDDSCASCTEAEPWPPACHNGCLCQGGVSWLAGMCTS